MQPKLKRSELDGLAEFHSLTPTKVEALLDLADARPSRAEGLRFLGLCLRIAGILSLAAGLVFFVAANWARIAVFGRFALVELVLAACAIVAFWKPPPRFAGRGALFLAFIATGALLALFGQTYQTGADVYELFLTWALLGLPLIVAAQWGVASAAWVLVLNLALILFCGWNPAGGLLWVLFGGVHFRPEQMIVGVAWLNLALWFVFEYWRVDAVPDWVRRLTLSCAFGFATWAGLLLIIDWGYGVRHTDNDPLTGFAILVAMVATTVFAARRRIDIYPLAVVMGTFIILSLAWLGQRNGFRDEGMF
ncbi:MAG: DUF2157 domain-containing protein, partial [Peristeroidobacter soli]